LIAGFQRRHPDIHIAASIGKLAKSYGEAVDLTLYRCIQEGIANAVRHGKAADLSIDLMEQQLASGRSSSKRSRSTLCLILRDDGVGFAQSAPKGFGLTTMTERARSLGGTCVIESAPSRGTVIRVAIPVQRGTNKRAKSLELAGGVS
jgi:two-component system sensor histidine kinase UhpB